MTRSFSCGLCPLVKFATRVFLDWKGRALSRRGVVYGTSVHGGHAEQNQSKANNERLLCGKLQWWTLPWDGHICVRIFRVGLKRFCYGWGWGRSEQTKQPISRQTYWHGQWRQNCVRLPRAGSTFGPVMYGYKQWVNHLYSLLAPKWPHFAFQRPISYFLSLSNQN